MNLKTIKKTDITCIPCMKEFRTTSIVRVFNNFAQTTAKTIHNSLVSIDNEQKETCAYQTEAEQKRAKGIMHAYRNAFK